MKERLYEEAENECFNMSEEISSYFAKDEVQDRLCEWKENETPDIQADDFEVTKFEADELIMGKIKNEVRRWESGCGYVKQMCDRLTNLFKQECQLLERDAREVSLIIVGDPLAGSTLFGKSHFYFNAPLPD